MPGRISVEFRTKEVLLPWLEEKQKEKETVCVVSCQKGN